MSTNNEATDVELKGEVSQLLEEVGYSLNILNGQVEVLRKKITPILGQERPQPDEDKESQGYNTSLGMNISGHVAFIKSMQREVEQITERVDL